MPVNLDPPERYVYFRLLVSPPLTVVFPSITYEVELQSLTESTRMHRLIAHEPGQLSAWQIGPVYSDRAWLEQAVTSYGVKVRCVTVAETIMRRLVKDGRAAIVPTPAIDELEHKPPRNPGKLYS